MGKKTPFETARKADPSIVLNLLQGEHPQTFALVMSFLEPNKASAIIQSLPSDVQGDLARRLSTLGSPDPEILYEVDRILSKKIGNPHSFPIRTGGVNCVVEILNLVDTSTQKQMIERLEDEDPELAEEIKRKMFVFEDVLSLTDTDLKRALRDISIRELATAIRGTEDEVRTKIIRNLDLVGKIVITVLEKKMKPLRVSEVEDCRSKIVSILRRLESDGEISLTHEEMI